MTLKEIVEHVQATPEGAVISDRSRFDIGYLESVIITYRARLLRLIYLKNKRINPVCYQKHWPKFEVDLQDDPCVVKFRHPEVISLDDMSDGFRYIGALSFTDAYPRIKSTAWLSTFNHNRVTAANNDRRTTVLYDGNQQVIEVRGNLEIEEIMTESLLANPLSVPTYNKAVDQFPLNEDLIPDLLAMIFQEQTSIEATVPLKPNSPTLAAQRGRRRS